MGDARLSESERNTASIARGPRVQVCPISHKPYALSLR